MRIWAETFHIWLVRGGLSEEIMMQLNDDDSLLNGPGRSRDVTAWPGYWTLSQPFQWQWYLKIWEQKANRDSTGLSCFLCGICSSHLEHRCCRRYSEARDPGLGSLQPHYHGTLCIPLELSCFPCKLWSLGQFLHIYFTCLSSQQPTRQVHLMDIETEG